MIKLDADLAREVIDARRQADPSLDDVVHGEVNMAGSEIIETLRDQILACCRSGRERHFTRALTEALVVHNFSFGAAQVISTVYTDADMLACEVYREWDRRQEEWEANNG